MTTTSASFCTLPEAASSTDAANGVVSSSIVVVVLALLATVCVGVSSLVVFGATGAVAANGTSASPIIVSGAGVVLVEAFVDVEDAPSPEPGVVVPP